MTAREREIVDTLAEMLQHDDPQRLLMARFDELGLDSLTGMRLAARLEARLNMPVDIEWLYDHPSARQLAAFLDSHADPTTRTARTTNDEHE